MNIKFRDFCISYVLRIYILNSVKLCESRSLQLYLYELFLNTHTFQGLSCAMLYTHTLNVLMLLFISCHAKVFYTFFSLFF